MRIFLDTRSADILPYGIGRYACETVAPLPAAAHSDRERIGDS